MSGAGGHPPEPAAAAAAAAGAAAAAADLAAAAAAVAAMHEAAMGSAEQLEAAIQQYPAAVDALWARRGSRLTPLMRAARGGKLGNVKRLLDAGASFLRS